MVPCYIFSIVLLNKEEFGWAPLCEPVMPMQIPHLHAYAC